MLGRIAIISFMLLGYDLRALANEIPPVAKPIDERIQIVGTIAQEHQSGQPRGVVILRDNDNNRTIFAELGKAFLIDNAAFRIARVDSQGAVITDGRQRFEVSYVNPPSNSGNDGLVYEAEEVAKDDEMQESNDDETA